MWLKEVLFKATRSDTITKGMNTSRRNNVLFCFPLEHSVLRSPRLWVGPGVWKPLSVFFLPIHNKIMFVLFPAELFIIGQTSLSAVLLLQTTSPGRFTSQRAFCLHRPLWKTYTAPILAHTCKCDTCASACSLTHAHMRFWKFLFTLLLLFLIFLLLY